MLWEVVPFSLCPRISLCTSSLFSILFYVFYGLINTSFTKVNEIINKFQEYKKEEYRKKNGY